MRRRSIVFGFAAALAVVTAAVASTARPEPVYVAGSNYTAVLEQQAQRWTLMPLDGADVEIRADAKQCASATIPTGLWIVGRDADGKPELVAPSQTFTASSGERIALHACGQPGTGVAAPQVLIDWLASNAGAVYVED